MDRPRELEGRLATAQQWLRDGEIDAAEREAAALCTAAPDDAAAFALHAACAAARPDWPAALARWGTCRARFPGEPTRWRLGLASALLQTGQPEEAEAAFAAALADQPDLIAAHAGRALAVSRARPGQAEALWCDVFRRVPGRKPPGWQLARAHALANSGAAEQAYTLLRIALDEAPDLRPAHNLLVRLLIETGRQDAASRDLDDGVLRAGGPASPAERARLQTWLGDIPGARASFAAALDGARDAPALAALFDAVPQSFEVYQRGEIWRALRARLAEIPAACEPRADCLRLRLNLALRDYDGFLTGFDAAVNLPLSWAARFARVAATLRGAAFPDFAAPRIFGIGLSKTGTSSLGRALETLGFLHAHFQNPFSNEILSEEDFYLFDAATDTPVSMRFEMLYHRFPNARFILSERPVDNWLDSFARHLQRRYGTSDFAALRRRATHRNHARYGADFAGIEAALYYNHPGPRAAWDIYDNRVTRFFADKPEHKLLRHNVFAGHGWSELCTFLDRPVPAEPYPWTNRSLA